MSLFKIIEKISYLDFLIRTRQTGCAHDLAEKLQVSERTIFYYLRELRDLGAPISWSGSANSYIYKGSGRILLCFSSEHRPEQSIKTTQNFYPGRQELFINLKI